MSGSFGKVSQKDLQRFFSKERYLLCEITSCNESFFGENKPLTSKISWVEPQRFFFVYPVLALNKLLFIRRATWLVRSAACGTTAFHRRVVYFRFKQFQAEIILVRCNLKLLSHHSLSTHCLQNNVSDDDAE